MILRSQVTTNLFQLNKKLDLEEQIDNMIDNKYSFVHANGVTAAQLERMEEQRFFDNKLVIIDEVHNLINGMASGGSMRALGLEKLFMDAYNLKLNFLSIRYTYEKYSF